jgi:hypothetical protein
MPERARARTESGRICAIVAAQEGDAIQPNGSAPEPDELPVPLKERLWFIALMMFVFFPVGLVLFWRHDLFPPSAKWAVTIVVLVSVVWALFAIGPR